MSGDQALFPDVKARLAEFDFGAGGTRLGIASNQNGVALGRLSATTARELLEAAVREAVGEVAGVVIEMCICAPDGDCDCRKPAPGLLLRLLERFQVAPEDALYVGDLAIDEEAARRASVPFRWADEFFARGPAGR